MPVLAMACVAVPELAVPLPVFPGNYDTADAEKVWDEFTKQTPKGHIAKAGKQQLHIVR